MNFWLVILGTGFYFSLCNCNGEPNLKLTCNEVTDTQKVKQGFNVGFKLFGLDSNDNLDEIDFSPTDKSDYFDPSRKTIVIIHGFTNNYAWVKPMAKGFLKREPVNVISVERDKYGPVAIYQYRKAALESEHISKAAFDFLAELMANNENMNKTFHFVGHSLGTHIVGQTARRLKDIGIPVQRMTALDPAYPCFEDDSAELRLKKTDAEFVDVIHTNCEPGENNKGNYGTYDPIGHMDFYVNGGNNQPGCLKDRERCSDKKSTGESMECHILDVMKKSKLLELAAKTTLKQFIEYDADLVIDNMMKGKKITCEHEESINYFIDTLDPAHPKTWGNPTTLPITEDQDLLKKNEDCDEKTCVEMGINSELYKDNYSGVFYVRIQ